eukprot:CAMPEP_0113466368 /NCGR_PEP_ID=MMETSP0014_2-20120614/14234_1 /TAXON_ID=2857 /ORGANISM="Nitzschia sp." /LENGTH=460 /DNA_ID=CAMNT_0000358585 /DNA_START=298 /DNA_END=1680 /DNA_ORIENTATION=- /assembly_acc=CAM_ASM_000159
MASSNFELQAKADEWMDVTPKEEVLESELKRLKEAFERCTDQLNASRLENELLKDSKSSLETQTATLQATLDATSETLQQTRSELEVTQQHLMDTHASAAQKDKIMEQLQAEQKAELETNHQTTKQLQTKLDAAEKNNTTYLATIADLQVQSRKKSDHIDSIEKSLKEAREGISLKDKQYQELQKKVETQHSEILKTKTTTGTIATLAEQLKAEKLTLKNQLDDTKQRLEQTKSSLTDKEMKLGQLQTRLEDMKSSLEANVDELKTQLDDRTFQSTTLQEMVTKLETDNEQLVDQSLERQAELHALQSHAQAMETGRHEWLSLRSELEESLEETLGDLESSNAKCMELESQLATIKEECTQYRQKVNSLLSNNSSDREEDLLLKLEEQQATFDRKLSEIRSILGLNFTAHVKSEVKIVKKAIIQHNNDMMPSSFKVPLMALPLPVTPGAGAISSSAIKCD